MQLSRKKFQKSYILSTQKWIKCFPAKNLVDFRKKSGDITPPSDHGDQHKEIPAVVIPVGEKPAEAATCPSSAGVGVAVEGQRHPPCPEPLESIQMYLVQPRRARPRAAWPGGGAHSYVRPPPSVAAHPRPRSVAKVGERRALARARLVSRSGRRRPRLS